MSNKGVRIVGQSKDGRNLFDWADCDPKIAEGQTFVVVENIRPGENGSTEADLVPYTHTKTLIFTGTVPTYLLILRPPIRKMATEMGLALGLIYFLCVASAFLFMTFAPYAALGFVALHLHWVLGFSLIGALYLIVRLVEGAERATWVLFLTFMAPVLWIILNQLIFSDPYYSITHPVDVDMAEVGKLAFEGAARFKVIGLVIVPLMSIALSLLGYSATGENLEKATKVLPDLVK